MTVKDPFLIIKERAYSVIAADADMPTERGVPLGWVDPTALALAHDALTLLAHIENIKKERDDIAATAAYWHDRYDASDGKRMA
jgi:hypothetical protein